MPLGIKTAAFFKALKEELNSAPSIALDTM